MKITKRNYFTTRNKYISNSKINDWLRDKHYFYRKHIIGDIIQKITDPMILGAAVDYWIMYGEKKFRETYILVSSRSRGSGNWEYQLNPTMYDKVEKMSRQITLQDAHKKLRGFKKQTILQYDIKLGLFDGLCGIPDWFKVLESGDTKTAIIVDLKTADNIDQRKYFYKCEDYGYFRQLALYSILIARSYDILFENIECRHLVVEKDSNEIYRCATFIFDKDRIRSEAKALLRILDDIAVEEKFAPHDATWEEAVII